jgi:regulation of enolase protein 1 (concanavalin A-like superfamily)
MKRSLHLLVIVVLTLASASTCVLAAATDAPRERAEPVPTLALPWPVTLENTATVCRVLGPTELELSAPAGVDLYISPDGKYRINKSPRLLFRPEGPFIFTAKIRPELKAMWDAGALMLFNDEEHFAKFCFELDPRGATRVVSVVCNGTADDCSALPVPVPDGAVYFRITGAVPGDTFSFYASVDGKTWYLMRSFRLMKTDALRLGFGAQSPSGTGCTAHFSEISLERRVPKDYWSGY